jgi:RNA polymerase sigma-70 factor, ECF subfamily
MGSHPQAAGEPNEEHLILRAIQGDEGAFGALYSQYLDAIYRYVFFRVGDSVEAEDLTEEVFVRAWEALPDYRVREFPFKSWLYRIAHNLTVDYHRKQKPLPLEDIDQLSGLLSRSAEDVAERQQLVKTLSKAVRKLSEEEQQVIVLRFIDGLSHQEISQIIGKSPEASRVIQHRALARLNEYMNR